MAHVFHRFVARSSKSAQVKELSMRALLATLAQQVAEDRFLR